MKKFLLSLCVGFLGIMSFCSAGSYTIQGNVKDGFNSNMVVPQSYYSKSFSVHCVFLSENINCQGGNVIQFGLKFAQIYNSQLLYSTLVNTNNSYSISCDNPSDIVIDYDFSTYTPGVGPYENYYGVYFINFSSFWALAGIDIPYTCTFVGDNILSAGGSCPEINTGEILSGYILESSIDTNYCVLNGLCPNECGSGTDMSGDLQYSNLFINNILHPGKENIFLNIQDNIFWDYSQDDTGYYIDVGSGYDQDYIDGVINVQSYRPTSEDFTQTFVGGLILFTPYVVILLFVILVRNLIKKIFKTK